MNVLSILGGNAFVMFNKEIAREVSVNGAIIFGQLCSSHESFGSKNMLTSHEGKEYFFLTSEVIEEETALTYKQQLKAIKDLEAAGYIQTVIMGSPAKKYFHITDKIFEQFKCSSDKREDLKEENQNEIPVLEQSNESYSYDKKEKQALPKGQSKPLPIGQAYKEINKRELNKNFKNNFVNKESVNNDEIIHKLTNKYRLKGLSKGVCELVVNEVLETEGVHNLGGYLRTCLENTLYKSKLKRGEIDFTERFKGRPVPFYNWLED